MSDTKPVIIGTIGDVDPLNDGGIILDHGDGRPTLDYFVCQNDEEYEDEKRIYLRYRADVLDIEDDLKTARSRHGWIDVGDVAQSSGQSVRALIRESRGTPVQRAWCIWTCALHYGWENFDSYPDQMTGPEVEAFCEQFEVKA